jgi:hypothetical protein
MRALLCSKFNKHGICKQTYIEQARNHKKGWKNIFLASTIDGNR